MVAVLAVVVGAVWAVLTWLGDHDRDLVNAGIWWRGWIGVPIAAALLAALVRRRGGPGPWLLALLVAPMAVAFVLHDARRPPTGLLAGRLDALAVLAAICAAVGLARRPREGRRRYRVRTAPPRISTIAMVGEDRARAGARQMVRAGLGRDPRPADPPSGVRPTPARSRCRARVAT